MNKALHLIRLFARNRLAEARRGIKRSLPTIVTLCISLFFAQGASADYIHWRYEAISPYQFSSPSMACAAAVERVKSLYSQYPHLNPVRLYEYKKVSGINWTCTILAGVDSYFTYPPVRFGDSCSPTDTYNPNTGECNFKPNNKQKGTPPDNLSCPKNTAGNPINFSIGNKFQQEIDYQGAGQFTLRFTRTYNSLDGLWQHSYSTNLRFEANSIVLVMADGRESYFTLQSGTAKAEKTELGQLTQVAGAWVYTSENDEHFTFDGQGRLTRWTHPSGAEQLLNYSGSQVTVTDNFGHTLSFIEDAQHQPLSLAVGSLQITYSYNGWKRLTRLTRTRGGQAEQRQYHYEDARNNALLTGITDERGVRYASWTYDDQGRAISSEHANGAEKVLVSYNADGSSTVTNALGKKATYRFQTIEGVKRITAIEGEALGSCPMSNSSFTYDERGLLKTKTDNKGHLTTYDYNERGLEVSRTEAAGTPQARTISTEWHPTLFLPVKVSEPGRVTTYTYDAQGRQLSQTRTAL